MEIPTLDTLCSELAELESRLLTDGHPAYLFRGERGNYPTTYCSLDRLHHDPNFKPDVHDQLADITAFCMTTPLDDARLPPKDAGAFAQHYHLPTQVFDFSARVGVAVNFAANRAKNPRPWPQVGAIAVLDVAVAEASRAVAIFDLRKFDRAIRARRQHAFGVIYQGFMADDRDDLKRPEITREIGLEWRRFSHLPDDETYLYLTRNDEDLERTDDDPSVKIPELVIDAFVESRGFIFHSTALYLAQTLFMESEVREYAVRRWSGTT